MSSKGSDLPHNLVAFVSDPISEQVIRSVVKELNMGFADVYNGGCNEASEFLKYNRSPNVLLVDIANSTLHINELMKIRENGIPDLSIIVIGGKNDVSIFRDLAELGAVDYIVKPLNTTVVKNAIIVANGGKLDVALKTGKMISCISANGGAGATTVATNLAWMFASVHFKRSAVMDIDFMFGTANSMLDIKAENSYLELLETPDKVDEYFLETIIKKKQHQLYYIGGLADLAREAHVDRAAFGALIDIIKKQFNYVLVDAPRYLTPITRECMNKSDVFIIMCELSIASAQNAIRVLEYLHMENPGKNTIIVANKVGFASRGAISKETFEQIVAKKINYFMPIDEVTVPAFANMGQMVGSSSSPVVPVLEDIINEILGKTEKIVIEKTVEQSDGGIVGLVKKQVENIMSIVGKK